jgi:hypothetical protein
VITLVWLRRNGSTLFSSLNGLHSTTWDVPHSGPYSLHTVSQYSCLAPVWLCHTLVPFPIHNRSCLICSASAGLCPPPPLRNHKLLNYSAPAGLCHTHAPTPSRSVVTVLPCSGWHVLQSGPISPVHSPTTDLLCPCCAQPHSVPPLIPHSVITVLPTGLCHQHSGPLFPPHSVITDLFCHC